MKYKKLGEFNASRVAIGAMRISTKPLDQIERLVNCALERGINLFDHADIYGGGNCERVFGELFKRNPALRDKIVLQTKCGIKSYGYDLSKRSIIQSVENSLASFGTDHIDLLLLHRPDTLMRPEEVAAAFDTLYNDGKVRCFGVSNFSSYQIELLKTAVNQPLVCNQMQFSFFHAFMVESGMNVNTDSNCSLVRDGGLIEYQRARNITLQTYSPFLCSYSEPSGYSYHGTLFADAPRKRYFSLFCELEGLAQKYMTTPESIALLWFLHHPCDMQVILGTTLDSHLTPYLDGIDGDISDYEWYKLYTAAGHKII